MGGELCYSLCIIIVLLIGFCQFHMVSTIYTYSMDIHCEGDITMMSDLIYQGRLTLALRKAYSGFVNGRLDENLSFCKVTIESFDDNLMFYFETFNISCDVGYLRASDGRPDFQIEVIPGLDNICGQVVPKDVFTTSTKYLTMQYTARNPRDAGQAFSIIFTSYKTGSCPSYRHRCNNDRCIREELRCNGFKSCGDGSGCPRGMPPAMVVGIVIGMLVLVCLMVVTMILIMICHRRRLRKERLTPIGLTAAINPIYSLH